MNVTVAGASYGVEMKKRNSEKRKRSPVEGMCEIMLECLNA